MERDRLHAAARRIFSAAVRAVDPRISVGRYAARVRSLMSDRSFERLFIIGFGKAACPMVLALEGVVGDIPTEGFVVTKYGHCPEHPRVVEHVVEAGHPVPDANGLAGTNGIMRLLDKADERTLVICLISGGGSALLVAPYEGITLGDKQRMTRLLLKAGADIYELNTVRKHLSNVKGGRLAERARPARFLSLILSDVIGDRLDVIASGPTAPDPTTYQDALRIIGKYSLENDAPPAVMQLLSRGAGGGLPETPKPGDAVFSRGENIIVGGNDIALAAASEEAALSGFDVEIVSSTVAGEARDVGRALADEARTIIAHRRKRKPLCLLSGGETTVTVNGKGLGGRNMELALAFSLAAEGLDGTVLLSAGTDGTDGPTDAAGAVVDGRTAGHGRRRGLPPEAYLDNNDSYNFFRGAGGLFVTGPTGTNVMDIQVLLIS